MSKSIEKQSPKQGTVKSTRKGSTAKTVTNKLKNDFMKPKTDVKNEEIHTTPTTEGNVQTEVISRGSESIRKPNSATQKPTSKRAKTATESGTVKKSAKCMTVKTIKNNVNLKTMVTKIESSKKPVAKRVTKVKKRPDMSVERIIRIISDEVELNFWVMNLNHFETLNHRKAYFEVMDEVLYAQKVSVAKEEVVQIEQAFAHMRLSSRHYGLPTKDLFGYYGYVDGTPHNKAIRELKMTEEERATMPWRYCDREPKAKNLERYQALSDYYHTNIVSHYPDVEQPMSLQHVAELIAIAKPMLK